MNFTEKEFWYRDNKVSKYFDIFVWKTIKNVLGLMYFPDVSGLKRITLFKEKKKKKRKKKLIQQG